MVEQTDYNKYASDAWEGFKSLVSETGQAIDNGLQKCGINYRNIDGDLLSPKSSTVYFYSGKEFYIHADLKNIGLAALALFAASMSSAPASLIMLGFTCYFVYQGCTRYDTLTHFGILAKENGEEVVKKGVEMVQDSVQEVAKGVKDVTKQVEKGLKDAKKKLGEDVGKAKDYVKRSNIGIWFTNTLGIGTRV